MIPASRRFLLDGRATVNRRDGGITFSLCTILVFFLEACDNQFWYFERNFESMLRLIIVTPDKEFFDTVRWRFRGFAEVEAVHGKFEDLRRFDCVVTAGNSFGLMDAGIDLAVVNFFGQSMQEKVQQMILADYLGEQPVGTSLIVETGMPAHPYLAHSPTMRVPLNISRTDNVYLAMWASLTAVHRHNRCSERRIETLACPGLGIGTGGMDHLEASYQMLLAWKHFVRPPEFLNGTLAQQRFEDVHYGSNWGFDNPRKPVI